MVQSSSRKQVNYQENWTNRGDILSKPKGRNPARQTFLHADLIDQLNPKNPLLQLARKIDWSVFENEFGGLYSHLGKPNKHIRLMVGLSMLKHLENLSDEVLVQRWVQNPYYQAFCGEIEFQWQLPCDPTSLTHFRKRIGVTGHEKILAVSIMLHAEKVEQEDEVCIDTTVQEKNITFPTDAKQYRKIHGKLLNLARREGISLDRTYEKEVKQLKQLKQHTRFATHPKNRKKARKAVKRFKTLSGRLIRAVERQMSVNQLEQHGEPLALFRRMLEQKRSDKNKLYSLHEPHVYCMSKGKAHQRYEFGTKASIATTRDSSIIIGALAFDQNQYDAHTLPAVMSQIKRLTDKTPTVGIADRGYRGKSKVNDTRIVTPGPARKNAAQEAIKLARKRFRRRAGIEPVIGHLKSDHRLKRNFLKGFNGDQINVIMAAAAFNFRKWMREIIFWLQKLFASGLPTLGRPRLLFNALA
jgi:IS5 family transposase